jgi:hypothetical protein
LGCFQSPKLIRGLDTLSSTLFYSISLGYDIQINKDSVFINT